MKRQHVSLVEYLDLVKPLWANEKIKLDSLPEWPLNDFKYAHKSGMTPLDAITAVFRLHTQPAHTGQEKSDEFRTRIS